MEPDLMLDPQMAQAGVALAVVLVLLLVGGAILFGAILLTWFLVRRRRRSRESLPSMQPMQPILQASEPTPRRDAAMIYGVRSQSIDDRFKLTDYQLQLIANRANELHRADQEVELDKLLVNLTRPAP